MGEEREQSTTVPLIRVGLMLLKPEELGFEKVVVKEDDAPSSDGKKVYTYVLYRHDVPLTIKTSGTIITLYDFANAITEHKDYPTLPFIRACRMLKRQKQAYFKCMEHNMQCRVEYAKDMIGLLRFALQRRGTDADISIEQDGKTKKPRHRIVGLKNAKQAVRYASYFQPYLGNRKYVDIAEEMYRLLVKTARKLNGRSAKRRTERAPA